jgi:SAM-dependent methyltransferase
MAALGDWLRDLDDPPRRDRIWGLGLLTGLRADGDSYRPANFERGLILDRLVELRRPAEVLEIGTGRGLGAFAIAAAAREYGVALRVTTLDIIPTSKAQDYPLEVAGQRQRLRASCDEVWSAHIDADLRERVVPVTGSSASILPRLAAAGRTFDLVFIDGGHDVHSVVNDLAFSCQLLAPGGAILMDDFAPLEEFGLGTCIAVTHARRLFRDVEVFPSEGLIYGGAVHADAPRGMVLLQDQMGAVNVDRARMWFWRIAGRMLGAMYHPRLFPARTGTHRR